MSAYGALSSHAHRRAQARPRTSGELGRISDALPQALLSVPKASDPAGLGAEAPVHPIELTRRGSS